MPKELDVITGLFPVRKAAAAPDQHLPFQFGKVPLGLALPIPISCRSVSTAGKHLPADLASWARTSFGLRIAPVNRQEAIDVCRTSSEIAETGKTFAVWLATFYLQQMFLLALGYPADHDRDSFSALHRSLVHGANSGRGVLDDGDLSARLRRGQRSHPARVAIASSASALGEVVV
ncbi:MAG: hypothetical protein ABSH56_22310 [Bryobacteraceae bacterium]